MPEELSQDVKGINRGRKERSKRRVTYLSCSRKISTTTKRMKMIKIRIGDASNAWGKIR